MAALADLVDPFTSSATLDTTWSSSTTGTYAPVISNGSCSIQAVSSYPSLATGVSTWDLSGSYIYAQFTPDTGTDCQLQLILTNNDGNSITFTYSGGEITYELSQDNTVTQGSYIAYSATSMAWWRIINSTGSTVLLQTAPDGATWTTQWTLTPTISLTAFQVIFQAGYYGSGTPTGSGSMTNLNTLPMATASAALTLSATSAARVPATSSASLALTETAAGAGHHPSTAAAILALADTTPATVGYAATSAAVITLTGSLSALQNLAATGTAVLVLSGAGTAQSSTPVLVETTQIDGTLILDPTLPIFSLERVLTNSQVSNDIIFTGTDVNSDPLTAEASDTSQTSPTDINGPFGDIVTVQQTSATTTQAALQSAAQTALNESLGQIDTIQLETIINPAIQIDDVCLVTRARAGVYGVLYVVDGFTYTRSPGGTMTISLRRVTY